MKSISKHRFFQYIGTPPYNVFLTVNQNRGREVHLAGQMLTSKASSLFFGTGDDKTNGSTIFYKNDSEIHWASGIPTKKKELIRHI